MSRATDWSPQTPLLGLLFSHSSGKLPQTLRLAFTLLVSPPLCLLYFCLAYNYLLSSPHDSLLDLSSASLALVIQGTVSAYNAWLFVGSWLYVVVCLLVWPMWLLPWTLSCQRVHPNPPHPHSEWLGLCTKCLFHNQICAPLIRHVVTSSKLLSQKVCKKKTQKFFLWKKRKRIIVASLLWTQGVQVVMVMSANEVTGVSITLELLIGD